MTARTLLRRLTRDPDFYQAVAYTFAAILGIILLTVVIPLLWTTRA